MLGLQRCRSSEGHQRAAAAPQKSGEALGNNRTSPTPAEEVPWPRTDTALLPIERSVVKPAARHPSHAQEVTTLCSFRLHFQSREATAGHSLLFCVLPWHWKFPPKLLQEDLMALKPVRFLSKAPCEPGECMDCPQQCPAPSAQCSTELPLKSSAHSWVRVGSRQLRKQPPRLC